MANVNRYLKRRCGKGRSGERWYLQLPVPKDLRGRFGSTIERCLNTSDPRVARTRRDAVLPEIMAMFDRARQEPTLDQALAAIRRDELARAHATWSEWASERGVSNAREALGELLDAEYAPVSDQEWQPSPSQAWQQRARRLLLLHGTAPADEATEAAAMALLEAHVDGAELVLEGRSLPARPITGADLASPVPANPGAVHSRLCTAVPLEHLLTEWERERQPVGRTKLDFARAMRRLADHVGHEHAARLTRDDITGFRDAMLKMGWKTTFNSLAAVKAVLNVGVRSGKLDNNPAAGVSVKRTARERRLPFDDAEAALILTAARRQRGGRRWAPWLLAYTGARLEEVCQAHVADIRQDSETWFLDINANGPGKTLKNAGSARKVPLHPALIEEGFLDYVKARRDGPLFPDLKPDCFGRRGSTATKALGRALRKLGIKDRRKVAGHSWRHRFKDLCRAAGVEKAVHDALTGHASRDVGDGYGLGYPLPILAAAIEKLPRQV